MVMTIKLLNNDKLYYEKQILYSNCEKLLIEYHGGCHCRNFAK